MTRSTWMTALLVGWMAVQPAKADEGFSAQTLHLTAPGTSFLGSHTPFTLGTMGYTAAMSTQYLRDPLVVVKDGDVLGKVVKNRVETAVHAAFGPIRWLDVGLDMPFVAYFDGQTLDGEAPGSGGLGDLRIWTKALALDQQRFYVDLGFVVTGTAPTGDSSLYAGANGFTGDVSAIVGRQLGPIYLSMDLGARLQKKHTALNFVDGHRILFGLATEWRHEPSNITVTGRFFGSALASAPFSKLTETNLEAVSAVSWLAWKQLVVTAGIGVGASPGANTPSYRALMSVGWHAGGDNTVPIAEEEPEEEEPEEEEPEKEKPKTQVDQDSDRDGVPDRLDKCPFVMEDFDGFEDHNGCPDTDNDGDQIVDAKDKCPNKKETYNQYKDDDGCPDKTLIRVDLKAGQIHVLVKSLVHFNWNQSEIPEQYERVLAQVADVLRATPEIDVLRIDGHASWTGAPDYNKRLSLVRARNVMNHLIRHGVKRKRLSAKGWGFERLKVKKKGPKFNHINRRVEFVIISNDRVTPADRDLEFEPEATDDASIPTRKPQFVDTPAKSRKPHFVDTPVTSTKKASQTTKEATKKKTKATRKKTEKSVIKPKQVPRDKNAPEKVPTEPPFVDTPVTPQSGKSKQKSTPPGTSQDPPFAHEPIEDQSEE